MPPPIPPPASSGTPDFPQQFGKYTLLRKLARGGMAELFLARKPDSPKLYVIKRVLPNMAMDKSFLAMFLTEAKVAAQLDHPNIIQIDALGREGTHIYQAMEYIDGIDLERLLKACGGRIPPDVMTAIGINLCDALCYANRCKDITTGKPLNVVHRDVTPGNVMITRQGVVKLVDFGVAKATAQLEKTKTGVVKGKFRYMSPEQLQMKELDGRSDLFSVGVLLYETTTGTKPFDRPQVLEVIRALTNWDPPPPTKLIKGFPKAVSDVIMQALAKDRDRRYQDGYAMSYALEEALATFDNPQSVEDFVTRFLPPPIEVPPFVPPKPAAKPKPSFASLDDDDDDDDQKTRMGVPDFALPGRRGGAAPSSQRGPAWNSAEEEDDDDKTSMDRSGLRSKADLGGAAARKSLPGFNPLDDEDASDGKTSMDRGGLRSKAALGGAAARRSHPGFNPLDGEDGDDRKTSMDRGDAKSKKALKAKASTFEDWEAPAGDVNAPDMEVPQPKPRLAASLAAPARSQQDGDGPAMDAPHHRGRAAVSRDDDDFSEAYSPDDAGLGSFRGGVAKSGRPISSGRKAGPLSSNGREKSSRGGSWSLAESVRPDPIVKDKDDSWKVSNAPPKSVADELALMEGKGGNPHAFRNLVIVLLVAIIGGGIVLVKSGAFSDSKKSPAVRAKGRLVVDGGQGSVTVNGKGCPLPCIQDVDSGVPIIVANPVNADRRKEIVIPPNETVRLSISDI